MDAKEFIQKFHNLEGVTVAEKQKSFNKLMHEGKTLLEDPVISRDIVANLEAKTYLESHFRVEILLLSHSVPELFEILKSGNEILIGKFLKQKWVFREAFHDMTVTQIINELFPKLSYSVRIKVLKGVTLAFENEAKLSELFDCYKSKYGLPAAIPTLLGCSVDKIESTFKNDVVFLTRSQVIKLLRKAPQLFPVYVEEHVKHLGDCDYLFKDDLFVKLLSSKYYDIFEVLKKKHKLTVCLGKRSTKKAFEKEKNQILVEPSKYKDDLKLGIFVRKLGKNGRFKQYFKSVFPESIEDFTSSNQEIMSLLALCPKNKRYQLLKDTFEEVYGERLIDCKSKLDISVLDLMCCDDDVEERSEVAEMMLKVTNNVDYAVYQRPAKSIPYLKREINLSSNSTQRKKLAKSLVNTCKINKDMAALVTVVQYMIARHKNDDTVVNEFLRYIEQQFDMHEFKKDLWDAIIELVDTYFVMNPKQTCYKNLLLHYAEFKFNSGESIKESIAKYGARDETGYMMFGHDCKNKKFLEQAIKDFAALYLEKDAEDDWYYYTLFSNLREWNSKNQASTISYLDYPKLLDKLRKVANSGSYNYRVSSLVCLKDRNHFTEEMSELFWGTYASTAKQKEIVYFFRWYPLMLLKYKDELFNEQLKETYEDIEYLLRWMKRYDYLKFPEEVVKFCKDKFASEDKIKSEVKFENLFAFLSRFITPEDFSNYITEYKPKDLSLDNWQNEEKALYYVHSSIAKSFKYTQHTKEMFPLLMSYCGGDFLKHVLDSLYKYFHHCPYNTLQSYLDQLASGLVSVRKHSLFLTCRIGDLESREKILKSFISTEKNVSLQKQFMLLALYSFLKYHSSAFWELFITSLASLKNDDKESFEKLVCLEKFVPKSYFSLYYQEIWTLIGKKDLTSSLKCTLRNSLVKKISSSVGGFPSEFCYRVIDTLLLQFSNDSSYDSDINTFVYNFLLHHQDPNRFSKILKILHSSKNSQANNVKLQKKVKKEISYFINRFCDFYHSCDENEKWDRKLLQEFADQLLNLYPPVEIFSDYLLLSFTCKLIGSKDLKDYAQNAPILIENMIQKYGVYILEEIKIAICQTLTFFYKGDESKNAVVEFIHELLNVKSTETNQVLCLLILLNDEDSNKPGFKECLKTFEESKIPYIQITLWRRKN